jgi:dihydroneopterin aldolase
VNRRDQITLAGMRFHALVGVLAHERELPQPLEVDVCVQLGRAMRGDQPTLDYRALYAYAEVVVQCDRAFDPAFDGGAGDA